MDNRINDFISNKRNRMAMRDAIKNQHDQELFDAATEAGAIKKMFNIAAKYDPIYNIDTFFDEEPTDDLSIPEAKEENKKHAEEAALLRAMKAAEVIEKQRIKRLDEWRSIIGIDNTLSDERMKDIISTDANATIALDDNINGHLGMAHDPKKTFNTIRDRIKDLKY